MLFRSLDALDDSLRGGAVAIGNFDGVHRGHAAIVQRLVVAARRVGGRAIAFTFDPHPAQLLRPDRAPTPLTWTERKAELLAALGVDAVLAYPTDAALLRLAPHEFFDRIVRQSLGAKAVVEGTNFVFGRDRRGTVRELRQLADAAGIAVQIVEPVVVAGEPVSSSRIRRLILAGDVEAANRLLVAAYRIRGTVVAGAGRGAALGFPTANLIGVDTLLPGEGVYAGRALVNDSAWPAAINVGPNPTFGETATKVEVHLIGWHGSLVGRPLAVDILARLRDTRRFDSPQALVEQLTADVAAARHIAT